MVTIRDVAKRAGVAVSTVSKVINKYPSVSEDTIARVNEAIAELHFIPNSVAASLSSKQSGRVAVLTDPDGQTALILREISAESAPAPKDKYVTFMNI